MYPSNTRELPQAQAFERELWELGGPRPDGHPWFGLALALRGNQISDFPLCNKSFNLSYCGHDL